MDQTSNETNATTGGAPRDVANSQQAATATQPNIVDGVRQPVINEQQRAQIDEAPLMGQPGPPLMPPIETQFPGVDQGLPGFEPPIAEYGTTAFETAQASHPIDDEASQAPVEGPREQQPFQANPAVTTQAAAGQPASGPSTPQQATYTAADAAFAPSASAQGAPAPAAAQPAQPQPAAQMQQMPQTPQSQGLAASAVRSVKVGRVAFEVSFLITLAGAILALIGVFVPYVGVSFLRQTQWASLMDISTTVAWVILIVLVEVVILSACKEGFAALILNANLAVFVVFVVANASSMANVTNQNAYMSARYGAAPWLLIIGVIVMIIGTFIMFYNQLNRKNAAKAAAAAAGTGAAAVNDAFAQSVSNYYNNVPVNTAAAQGPNDAYAASVSAYYVGSAAPAEPAQDMPVDAQAPAAPVVPAAPAAPAVPAATGQGMPNQPEQ